MDADRLKASLGQAIRDRRQQLGYSQEAFAAEIGMHRTYMGGIERGERNVSLENLNLIAEGLDLELSGLFKQAENLAKSRGKRRS